MKYCFIDQYCSEFGVTKMCRALGVSRSGYYGWKKQPRGKRRKDEEELLMEIKESYRKSKGNYGAQGLPMISVIRDYVAARTGSPGL